MALTIILLAVAIAALIFIIPLSAFLGLTIVGVVIDVEYAPIGAFGGYIVGIILWVGALILGIFQVANLVQLLS